MEYDRRCDPLDLSCEPIEGTTAPVSVDPLVALSGLYGNDYMQQLLVSQDEAGFCRAVPELEVPELAPEEAPLAAQEEDGIGFMDVVHGVLDVAGLVPGFGEIADGVNALAYAAEGDAVNAGLSAAAMVPFLGWGATTAKIGRKGAKAVNALDTVNDARKAGQTLSPRAARREAMRQAGIPTSQQPIAQQSAKSFPGAPPAGRQYTYDVNGETISVQHALTDDVLGHGPHWEAGPVKVDDLGQPRLDPVGRPKLENGKVKVEE